MGAGKRRVAVSMAVVLAFASAPLLVGCSGDSVHGIVSGATGGKVNVGGTTIPKDFPKSVPLYHGTVTSVTAVGSGSHRVYNIGIQVPGVVTMASIESALNSAGYKTEVEGDIGKVGASLVSTGPDYSVAVVLAKNSKGYQANYTVAPVDKSS